MFITHWASILTQYSMSSASPKFIVSGTLLMCTTVLFLSASLASASFLFKSSSAFFMAATSTLFTLSVSEGPLHERFALMSYFSMFFLKAAFSSSPFGSNTSLNFLPSKRNNLFSKEKKCLPSSFFGT